MSWVERTMSHTVWSHLEDIGCEVWAEQGRSDSRLDLVARVPGGGFAVVEFKAGTALNKFTLGNQILEQLHSYLVKYSLKGIALCVPEQDRGIPTEFKESRLGLLRERQSERNLFDLERMRIFSSPVFPPVTSEVMDNDLPVTSELAFPLNHDNEEELRHALWKELNEKESQIVRRLVQNLGLPSSVPAYPVCEGEIRKSYERKCGQVDLAVLMSSRDPLDCMGIVGIEVKADLEDAGIPSQLDKYADSLNLFQLYLAVPAAKTEEARKILARCKHGGAIGIIAVRTSNQQTLETFEPDITGQPLEVVKLSKTITDTPDVYPADDSGKRARAIYGSDKLFEKYVRPYVT